LGSLPADVPRVQELVVELVKNGQEHGEVKRGDATLLADLPGDAVCTLSYFAAEKGAMPVGPVGRR
jgi:hypothetical protein